MRARFFALTSLVLFADLGSKAWALRALGGGPRSLLGERISLVLAHNPNGAMGFLRQAPLEARRALLVAAALLASIALVALARRTESAPARAGLALVLGGALGNVIDRLVHGAVVDFIDVVYWAGQHYPTFNVADIAIVVGAVLTALTMSRTAPARARA